MSWTQLQAGKRGKGSTWQHESGWRLQHCGGHSALWPYLLVDPAHPEAVTLSDTGRGFVSVAVAKAVIEALALGRLQTTDERCAHGVRVVRNVGAHGQPRRAA